MHEILVEVNEKYSCLDPMLISVMEKWSGLLDSYFIDVINMSLT